MEENKTKVEKENLEDVAGGKYARPEVEKIKVEQGKNIAASGCEHDHEGAKERCIEW